MTLKQAIESKLSFINETMTYNKQRANLRKQEGSSEYHYWMAQYHQSNAQRILLEDILKDGKI